MTPQQIEDKAIDIATSIQLTDNTLREAAEQKRELVRMIADAIRAACAERDRQAVAWVRTHHYSFSNRHGGQVVEDEPDTASLKISEGLAAHLAQLNGGGK